jgi:hypothetical protein
MTAARPYDSVRTTAPAGSLFYGRIIPAGMEGAVLEVMPDGICLAELAFRPQTAGQDGDLVQAVLTEGQYAITRPWLSGPAG